MGPHISSPVIRPGLLLFSQMFSSNSFHRWLNLQAFMRNVRSDTSAPVLFPHPRLGSLLVRPPWEDLPCPRAPLEKLLMLLKAGREQSQAAAGGPIPTPSFRRMLPSSRHGRPPTVYRLCSATVAEATPSQAGLLAGLERTRLIYGVI